MDPANAFIGRTIQPSPAETAAALGPSAKAWDQLVAWLDSDHGVNGREWNSSGPKHGWTLRLKIKKRNILYLAPCNACFRVALVLGDRAIAAARQSNPSKSLLKTLDEATGYAEGTAIRLIVKGSKDLAPIRKLALIKLAY